MRINFITTNTLKYRAAKAFFDELDSGHELVQYPVDTPEIQASSTGEIAGQSAVWMAKEIGEPCVKMDVGFFIDSLNGFPGPFVKYVNDWLSQDDILRLMHGQTSRNAYFEDALAIGYPGGTAHVFTTKTMGTIAESLDPHNTKWTMNSLFIPKGHAKTLGSMSESEQTEFWKDGKAWPQLVEFLKQQ